MGIFFLHTNLGDCVTGNLIGRNMVFMKILGCFYRKGTKVLHILIKTLKLVPSNCPQIHKGKKTHIHNSIIEGSGAINIGNN